MHQALSKLLSIAGGPLGNRVADDDCVRYLGRWGALGEELAELLTRKNGFYAYEFALLLRPLQPDSRPLGLAEWNTDDLWREQYTEGMSDVLFFAEDVFGGQFCLRGGKVCTFDPETGLFDLMSDSVYAWASDILIDFEFRTGQPLAHAWQVNNGPLPSGVRLLPKTPSFVADRSKSITCILSMTLKECCFAHPLRIKSVICPMDHR